MKKYNTAYKGENLNQIAFPLGGLGAGMFCIQGTGTLGSFSLRNSPDVHNEPNIFSAICIKGEKNKAKVLEGPVPKWKIFNGPFWQAGNGLHGKNYGLPRFAGCTFEAKFPFAYLKLTDETMPVEVNIKAWSPFLPGDADNSSLPVGIVEYTFTNLTSYDIDAVYYINSYNFMKQSDSQEINRAKDGFILNQPAEDDEPWKQGSAYVFIDSEAKIDTAWFRGGWFDTLTMLWNNIERGTAEDREYPDGGTSAGASAALPFTLKPGESKTVKMTICWYVPETNLREGNDPENTAGESSCSGGCCCKKERKPDKPKHKPWYSGRFANVTEVHDYVIENYEMLYKGSKNFSDCLYDTTLPDEAMEAITANLTILKSPTILRQTDGRIWCYEGCCDGNGCCTGSCTHVWNYAQALCHLFPELERSLRQTEFHDSQDDRGHQNFRAFLPIRPTDHNFHAASDGQLGGIMKIYRDYLISGDIEWLKGIWGKVKQSLNYCITTWDINREGVLRAPHHNTYDIEFWGPDGMCSSFYLGALKAASLMANIIGDDSKEYDDLYGKGRKYLEEKLFNGEYFIQEVSREWIADELGSRNVHPEERELLEKEGPKYQYGTGCLSDGVLGAWMAEVCGVGEILDRKKVISHLESIYKYNYKRSLSHHANPQRPGYAVGEEGGLLLCSWPYGSKPSLPFVYSDEVWTGIEYQVASHLIMMGRLQEGLDIVKTCRDRYDGTVRNPFNEYECGHWYARAMSSYALFQAISGVRYDAAAKTLHIRKSDEGDFRSFLSTASGYGTVGIHNGEPFIDVKHGIIEVKQIICVE